MPYSYFVSGHARVEENTPFPDNNDPAFVIPFETVLTLREPVTTEAALASVRRECQRQVEADAAVKRCHHVTIRVVSLTAFSQE